MPAPQKGKAPTKGAKQIVVENAATITFYRNMALGSTVFYGMSMSIFYQFAISPGIIMLYLLTTLIHVGCYQMMRFASRPRWSDNSSELISPGLDLNMEGGMGEHIKDIVILVSITNILAVISSYFWFMLLLLPLRACWLVWTNFLGPWFFQEAPQDTEQDEKKRKKMERKMKRYQQ